LAIPEHERVDRVVELTGLTIEFQKSRAAFTVRLVGDLDLEGAPLVESELVRLVSSDGKPVVVDLSGLEFIDSTGLQSLLRASRMAEARGKPVSYTGASAQVAKVLAVTGLDEVLSFGE
jgi:anti-sigma B factor antagonist